MTFFYAIMDKFVLVKLMVSFILEVKYLKYHLW